MADVKALRVLESVMGYAEGRTVLCEGVKEAVPVAVGKMMNAKRDGGRGCTAHGRAL